MSQTKAQLISDLVQALNFTGTASAPANGAFLSAANTLALATNSAQRLTIDSSGRLLLGTTTEGESTLDDLTIATSGDTGITIRSGTSNNGAIGFSDGTSGADEYRGLIDYDHNGNYFRFYTNASERMRIDSSGNVGIGTTSPAEKLTLGDGDLKFFHSNAGNAHRTTFIEFGNSSNRITSEMNYGSDNSSNYTAGLKFTTKNFNGSSFATVDALNIQANGRVGIGITSPLAALHVRDSGTTNLRVDNSDDGTASLTLGNTGSSNLVIAQTSANATFSIGGSEHLRIAGSGKVGIGTSSPSELLHLKSSSPRITMEDTGTDAIFRINADSGVGNVNLDVDLNSDTSSPQLYFNIKGSERMRLKASGSHTITGSLSISENLSVSDSSGEAIIQATGFEGYDAALQLIADQGDDNGDRWKIVSVGSTNTLNLQNNISGGNVTKWKVDTDGTVTQTGNLNITKSSGDPILLVSGPGHAQLTLTSTSGTDHTGVNFGDSSDSNAGMIQYTNSSNEMQIHTNGSERVRIDEVGRVGINTTNPSAQLEVINGSSGRSWTPQSSTEFLVERNGNCFISIVGTNTANSMVNFGDAADENAGAIDYDHNNNSMILRVNAGTKMKISSNGDIGAPSGDNIYDASDERLKENMLELTDGLNKINKLKPISYNYKVGWNTDTEGKTKYGFGAQTTEKVDKLLVESFSDEDVILNGETISNPLRVNEKFIVPMLVKAVQELSALNTALETRVAALEAG